MSLLTLLDCCLDARSERVFDSKYSDEGQSLVNLQVCLLLLATHTLWESLLGVKLVLRMEGAFIKELIYSLVKHFLLDLFLRNLKDLFLSRWRLLRPSIRRLRFDNQLSNCTQKVSHRHVLVSEAKGPITALRHVLQYLTFDIISLIQVKADSTSDAHGRVRLPLVVNIG